ncbi:hypothetical protein VTN00DRAFT_3459 [Thermoascus crustaceus]|uniref:uncharacterized protein n=1 Tax=Thermoascus crustaceus TaxID=5088 RepID=UPI00374338B5
MTRAEAEALDPAQRLLLECTYEALENGGIPMEKIVGSKTSVFVGSFATDYTDLLLRDPEAVPMYQCTNASQSRAMISNRLSYFFDLHGPCVTVDTACSGSLVALHLGCQSLRAGDAKCSIVAGVNVILNHEFMITMSMMRFLSPNGRCYTFDERANGYARGEGVGCVVLKPLADALRDGDTIRAVIRGTGSNQDGKTSGITLPNPDAQEALIRDVYEAAGLHPRETSYVEAHGTGTSAGDPLETRALSKVFCKNRAPDKPLIIGSIKSNLGHLEGASGIASVIKTVLMLENETILPNRNFKYPNPRIPFYEWKLKVPVFVHPWDIKGPHRASINSFGYGGSNAHAIIESAREYLDSRAIKGSFRHFKSLRSQNEKTDVDVTDKDSSTDYRNGVTRISTYTKQGCPNGTIDLPEANGDEINVPIESHKGDSHGPMAEDDEPTRLFVLSAFDEASGKRQIENLLNYIEERIETTDSKFLDDLAFTLNERRTKFIWKAAIQGRSMADIKSSLLRSIKFDKSFKTPTVSFIFTGQGAQWCGMGRELLAAYPVFKNTIERITEHLKTLKAPFDVKDELTKDPERSQINLALYSQPLCSAVQIALVDLLASWGVRPDSVTGHSSGEIAAAYAAGALSLEDAMAVSYYRGLASSHMQQKATTKGAMMAVGMSKEDVEPLIAALTTGKITVACVNSPQSITVSGDVEAINELKAILDEKKLFARRLAVEIAYHSHHMALVAEEYANSISGIRTLKATDVEIFSSVTGKRATAAELGSSYWIANLLGQVKFADSVREMCLETARGKKTRKQAQRGRLNLLIEIGPHSALAGPIKQILQGEAKLKDSQTSYISALVRKESAITTMLTLAGKLATQSYPLKFAAINRPMGWESHNVLVDLPPYSWNHSNSYWAEPRLSKTLRERTSPRKDLLGALDRNSNPLESRWRNHLRLSEIPWVRHHKIQSNILYPAAGFIAMAIEAACERAKQRSLKAISGYKFREIAIGTALLIPEQDDGVETFISLKPFSDSLRGPNGSWEEFHVYSVTAANSWTEHCRGLISVQFVEKDRNVFNRESRIKHEKALSEKLAGIAERCTDDVETSGLYRRMRNFGQDYGETFANMDMARSGIETAIGTIVIPDTAAVMPAQYQYPFVIHPATLDTALHLVFVAKYGERGPLDEPAIPIFADEIFVSHQFPTDIGHKLSAHVFLSERDRRSFRSSIWITDPEQPRCEPLVSFTDLHWRILGRDVQKESTRNNERTAYAFKWDADIDMLFNENVATLCGGPAPTEQQLVRQAHACVIPEEARLQINTNNGFCHGHICQAVRRFLSLLGHKNPHLSVMEIDSGFGSVAVPIVQTLTVSDDGYIPNFRKYTLTGTNPSVFESIKTKLSSVQDIVVFKELDIEVDALKQGFPEGSFDVVIALHGVGGVEATDEVLKNIGKLLRPDGRLILLDVTRDYMASMATSGVLSDWSSAQNGQRQQDSAPISEGEWKQKLAKAGYGDVECVVRDHANESEHDALMIVTIARTAVVAAPKAVLIVDEKKGDDSGVDATRLAELLARSGTEAEIVAFRDAEPAGKTCIVLGDLDGTITSDPSEEQFAIIKNIFLKSNGALWVTRGGTVCSQNPNANVVTGLARTARSENDGSTIVTLDLDGEEPLSSFAASEVVYSLFRRRFAYQHSSESNVDLEYAERRGILMIPRIVEDQELNKAISSISNPVPEDQLFHQAGRQLRLEVGSKYMEDLYFVDEKKCSRDLADESIEVEVKAVGLNARDALVASGEVKMEPLGVECSGIVTAVGRSVQNIARGDRVAGFALGAMSSSYCGRASAFQRIPEYMSFDTAASLPIAYTTAYYVVRHTAGLSGREKVLIHSATAVLGQALIELCLDAGAEILVSVPTLQDKNLLLSQYTIPEDHILDSDDANIKEEIMRLTSGKGLDVVINCSTGEALRLAWHCIAPYGRFVDLGTHNADLNTRLEMMNFRRNASFVDVKSALQKVKTERSFKTIVVSNRGAIVKVLPRDTNSNIFRPDASYLLVGGLGGIGRAMALWMTDHGARNLIFANRSGLSKEEARYTVDQLQQRGVKVKVYSCDVSKSEQVSKLVNESSTSMPPIRGAIQGAMVLRDMLLEKMTVSDYKAVTDPKIKGTWNLHKFLPKDLDFFVMLSSISGIVGNATQASYAAGNTFLDAFAAFRNSLGLSAVTLDLGVITGVGYLSSNENKDLLDAMERQGFEATDEENLMALIQSVLAKPRRDFNLAQTVTGLGTWKKGTSLPAFDLSVFSRFRRLSLYAQDGASGEDALANQLRRMLGSAKTINEATELVCAALIDKLASRSGIPPDNIDSSKSISEYGVDSLVAVELRNWIASEMDSTVPILELLANISMLQLSGKIAARSKLLNLESDKT